MKSLTVTLLKYITMCIIIFTFLKTVKLNSYIYGFCFIEMDLCLSAHIVVMQKTHFEIMCTEQQLIQATLQDRKPTRIWTTTTAVTQPHFTQAADADFLISLLPVPSPAPLRLPHTPPYSHFLLLFSSLTLLPRQQNLTMREGE